MNAKLFLRWIFVLSLTGIVAALSLGAGLLGLGNPAAEVHGKAAALEAEGAFLPVVVKNSDSSDCSAIQSAINSLPATGGQVIIASGIYTCATALVIDRSHVELVGQGPATVLRLADGANSPVLVVGQTTTPPALLREHIRIANLSIDGNRTMQSQECWGGSCDSGGLTYIRNSGIVLRHVSDVKIENVSVKSARSGGLVTEKVCQRVTVESFTSSDNEFDGIALYETENSLFTGLHLHDNPYAGISLDIRFDHNIISHAVLTDNGKQGIFMRDSRDNMFSDIQIRGSGEQGLFLAQVDSDTTKAAAGNTFSGLVVSGSAQAGMRVNDASCINNLVTGAQFIENQSCISEQVDGLVQQIGVVCR